MKALSFSQPWAWVVVYGGKRVENRRWTAWADMIGQRFAIHAAMSWDQEAYDDLVDGAYGDLGAPLPTKRHKILWAHGPDDPVVTPAERFIQGGVLACATLTGCVDDNRKHLHQLGLNALRGHQLTGLPADQHRFFFGPYGFILDDVRPLSVVLPCKGMLGFWQLPEHINRAVENEMRAWDANEHPNRPAKEQRT